MQRRPCNGLAPLTYSFNVENFHARDARPQDEARLAVWDSLELFESSDQKPLVLKQWKASDFASMFVRFRPHLEAYSSRYLSDPHQREDVVQDAFLYLMTALPELDSEAGALRFLKWKVKMLCIDILRASHKAPLSMPDDELEQFRTESAPDPVDELEKAEDLAMVSAALSRLTENQQLAIVGSLIEGREHSEMARTLAMSENAFRQLLYRARATMKSALSEEAKSRGLEISQVVSLAARKAAATLATKSGALGVILVLALVALVPSLGGMNSDVVRTAGSQVVADRNLPVPQVTTPPSAAGQPGTVEEQSAPNAELAETADSDAPISDSGKNASAQTAPASAEQADGPSMELASSEVVGEEENRFLLQSEAASVLNESSGGDFADLGLAFADKATVRAITSEGSEVEILLSEDTLNTRIFVTLTLDSGQRIVLVPEAVATNLEQFGEGQLLMHLAATDFVVGDVGGEFGSVTSTLSPDFGNYYLTIRLVFNSAGEATRVQTRWVNRT